MIIKIGIIGAGKMAKIRADALMKVGHTQIIWILSKNGETAKQLAKKYQCQHYGKWENRNDVVKDVSVDLILIEVPHFIQDACSKWALLEQNAHLLIGGPLALNYEAGHEILCMARKKNRLIETGFEQLYTFYKEVANFMNQLGEIIDIQSNAEFPANPESWYYNEAESGGMILTHLTYCFLTPVYQLLSDQVVLESIYAVGDQYVRKSNQYVSYEVCTAVLTFVQKRNNKKIVYIARGSYIKSSNVDPWCIIIRGTHGTMKLCPPLDSPDGIISISIFFSNTIDIKINKTNPFQVQATAFIEAIKENKTKTLMNTAEKGLQILQIVHMIECSIKKGIPILREREEEITLKKTDAAKAVEDAANAKANVDKENKAIAELEIRKEKLLRKQDLISHLIGPLLVLRLGDLQNLLDPRINIIELLKIEGALNYLKRFEDVLINMYKKGIGKDLKSMSEEEQIQLATILSLRESGNSFNPENNRFTRELGLVCQNVLGDGFCLFRAIAKQIVDRNLNVHRQPLLLPLPTTMEGILERVALYFSAHSKELMDRIFPLPRREEFGTGERSDELYEAALNEYNNPGERQRRLEGFRDKFYEFINLGRYETDGQLLNAADWLPQVMSDVLQIDIDIYDQQPGGGFRTQNGHGQRIGLGRINNNHYISLDGNLEAAWLAEQQSILQVNLSRGKLIKVSPQIAHYFQQKQALDEQFLLLRADFKLQQLVQAKKIGEYLMDQIHGPAVREILKVLNEVKEEIRDNVLKALQPNELEELWKAVIKLSGHENLKIDLWKAQEKPMHVVLYKPKIE